MKALLSVTLMLSVTFAGFAQDEWNQTNSSGEKHGKWAGYYDSGDVRYIGQFDNGDPYGTFTYYYDETEITKMSMTYRDPDTAYAIAYYNLEDGTKMAEGLYVSQMKDSTWVFYDARGILSSKAEYTEDMLNGVETVYYLDGEVMSITNYENDVRHGDWYEYWEDGMKKVYGVYTSDCLEGQVTYYHPAGKVELQGYYRSCVPHGYWYQYDEQGNEVNSIFYKYGVELEGDAIDAYLESIGVDTDDGDSDVEDE